MLNCIHMCVYLSYSLWDISSCSMCACSYTHAHASTHTWDCSQVNERQFIRMYEAPGLPVVVTDSQLDWQANRKWTIEVCAGSSIITFTLTLYLCLCQGEEEGEVCGGLFECE